jgi:transcriptional regulator of acetoin/glycerol metabolism
MTEKTGKQILDTSRQVMRAFMDYDWPGNVRELENAIEHSFVLCGNDRIQLEDLPVELRGKVNGSRGTSGPKTRALPKREKITRESLLSLLEDCSWSKAEAARRLGLSHTSIWKYMKKWNIPLSRDNQ